MALLYHTDKKCRRDMRFTRRQGSWLGWKGGQTGKEIYIYFFNFFSPTQATLCVCSPFVQPPQKSELHPEEA